MSRDDFSPQIKEMLAKRVGYTCSNPNCKRPTIAPSNTDETKAQYIGVAAHIHSASPNKGPRANPQLTSEERSSINNGIHLCSSCSVLIDKNNGIDYPVSLLRNWKKQAEEIALKKMNHYIYENQWKLITFDNLEKEYSTALAGISLDERHVKSCVVNQYYINLIVEKLDLSYSTIILGKTGTGKSLLTYQIAYEYHKNGWTVYKLFNDEEISFIIKPLQTNEKIFIIIDDAHTISKIIFDDLLKLSNENTHILLNWNTSILKWNYFRKNINSLEINSKEQVELLKNYCLKNQNFLYEKIKKYDKNLGKFYTDTKIKDKIDIASRQETPWLFNYVLTNGWRNAQHEVNLLKQNNRMDVVLITIAFYQVASLDAGVTETLIFNSLTLFFDIHEHEFEIKKTIDEHCLKKDNKVLLKHYQFARKIIPSLLKESDNSVIKYIEELCIMIFKNEFFLKGYSSLIELLSFDLKPIADSLIKRDYFNNFLTIFLQKDSLNSYEAYTVNSLIRVDKSLIKVLNENNTVLKKWFSSFNFDNTFALSNLANTLYNNKYNKDFIDINLVEELSVYLLSNEIEVSYRHFQLLNRLSLFFNDSQNKLILKKLNNNEISYTLNENSPNILFYLATILENLFYIDKKIASKVFNQYLDFICNSFNNTPLKSYIDFRKVFHICFGQLFQILGGYKKEKTMYPEAEILVNKIDIRSITKFINQIKLEELHEFSNFLLFYLTHGEDKIRTISNEIDFDYLINLLKNETLTEHDITIFVMSIIEITNKSNVFDILSSKLLKNFNEYPTYFAMLDINKITDIIRNNENKFLLISDSRDFGVFGLIFYSFDRNKIIKEKLIAKNKNFIEKELFSTVINCDNKLEKLYFYDYLFNFHKDFLIDLFKRNHLESFKEKTLRLSNGSDIEKDFSSLYFYMLKEFSDLDTNIIVEKTTINKYINRNYENFYGKKIIELSEDT